MRKYHTEQEYWYSKHFHFSTPTYTIKLNQMSVLDVGFSFFKNFSCMVASDNYH